MRRHGWRASLLVLALGVGLLPALERAEPAAQPGLDYNLSAVQAAMQRGAERVGPAPAEAAAYFADRPFGWAHSSSEGVTLSQPDGTQFKARSLEITEGGGQATMDGHLITRDDDGWWRYGEREDSGRITPSEALVGRDDAPVTSSVDHITDGFAQTLATFGQYHEQLRQWMQSRTASMAFEAAQVGEPVVFRIPALMFAIHGQDFQPENTAESLKSQLDGIGTSPTGTITEMYLEQSFGNMVIEIDVYGPYTSVVSQPPNDCWYGTDGGPILGEALGLGGLGSRGMAIEAVPMSDADVNYSDYDNDGDGWVDFLLIIHSGPGAESTANPCHVHSHYFGSIAGEPTIASTDGVLIGPVMTVPEIDSAIGVTAHEIMHALGEPDYYGTAGTSGTGDWDLGAGGSWLGIPAQTNPIHFNPVMKINFDWIEPTRIDATALDQILRPRASYPDLIQVPLKIAKAGTDAADMCDKAPIGGIPGQNNAFYDEAGDCLVEGLLIENLSRVSAASNADVCTFQPADFDRQAYGSGLAIWHWDFTNYQQLGNNNILRPMLDLKEFDRRALQQHMSSDITRGNPLDMFWGDPVGVSGATQVAAEEAGVAPPDGSPFSVTGAPGLGAEGTEATPIPEWVAADGPPGTGMVVTLSWGVETDDWDLYVDKMVGDEWVEVANSAGGAPQTSEQVTLFDFSGGDQFRARAYNWLGPTSPQAEVEVRYDTTSITQLGPAGTRNNDLEQTGWQITNIRPNDYRGLAHASEQPGQAITIDLIKHDDTTVDVSPDFLRLVQDAPEPVIAGQQVTLSTPVYNHGGKPVSGATFALFDRDPATGATPLATVTRDLGGYDRQEIEFTYTPTPGWNELFVRSSAAGDQVPGNDVVRTELRANGLPNADLLIVDNDFGWTQEEAYEAVLQGLGVAYHVVEGEPSAATLADYGAVVWLTTTVSGYQGVLSSAALDAIVEYLDGGGRLWLTSARASAYISTDGFHGRPEVMEGYFGVTHDNNLLNSPGTLTTLGDTIAVPPDGPAVGPAGEPASIPVGYLDGRPYLDYGDLAEAEDVNGTAVGIFSHDQRPDKVVMTRVEGDSGFRTVWGIPLGLVSSARDQVVLMSGILAFFEIPTGVADPTSPAIKHLRFAHVQVGQDWPVAVGAVAPDGITSVELRYRDFGDDAWRTLALDPVGDGMYEGTIPGSHIANNGLQYYVRALTTGGTVIESAGGAELPNVASAPYGDPADVDFGVCAAGPAGPVEPAPSPLPTTGAGFVVLAVALLAAASGIRGRRQGT